jgi:hypothetical protein
MFSRLRFKYNVCAPAALTLLGLPPALGTRKHPPHAATLKPRAHGVGRPVLCGGEEFLQQMQLGSILNAKQTSSPDALVHLGRLKAAHDASEQLFGISGEKVAQIWGDKEAAFASTHVATEALNPTCLILSAAHAALACFDGARLLGNRANPSPPATLLIGIGSDSVGKSRQTSFALKLLTQLQRSVKPSLPVQSTEDRANAESERAGTSDRPRGKLCKDGFSAQSFSGKGFASRCMDGKLRAPVFLIDEALSLFTQIGLASDPAKVTDSQLEDQAMMSTIWSTGTYRKDLADGGGYDLPWTCPSFHTSAHIDYMCRLLSGETGKDPTAFRRRMLVYAFRPMFRHKVKEYLVQQGLATESTVDAVLQQWPNKTSAIVQRLKVMYDHFAEAKCEERLIDLSPAARELYDDFLDKAGRAQEEFMYTRLYATSVLGKLPEVALRASVLAWCAAYLSGAEDATLVTDGSQRKAILSVRHFTMGKFLAASSLRVQAALLTPAPVPTMLPQFAAPGRLVRQSLAGASRPFSSPTGVTTPSGSLPQMQGDLPRPTGLPSPAPGRLDEPAPSGGLPQTQNDSSLPTGLLLRADVPALTEPLPGKTEHVQDSFLKDREIIRRTIIAVSSWIKTQSIVPAKLCNSWKKKEAKKQLPQGQAKPKEFRVTVAQWTAVMKHAASQGLGSLMHAGTQEAAFHFAVDVPVSVESPQYTAWHNKLMTICATSAEEYANHRVLKPDEEPPLAPAEESAVEVDEEALEVSAEPSAPNQKKRQADQPAEMLRAGVGEDTDDDQHTSAHPNIH